MNPYYNQKYTKKDIEKILNKIKQCVRDNKYIIAMNENRKDNRDFINEYNIRSDKQKNILKQMQTEDFCYTLQNTKVGFENEVLYVFVPQLQLYNVDGIKEKVVIYTKFNLIEMPYGHRVAVISFHKRNKPITYVFR